MTRPEEPKDFGYAFVERYSEELWLALENRADYDAWLQRMPKEVPEIIAAWWLTGEVENGGFDQYFSNSYGGMIDEAIRGLEMTGQVELAMAAREAKREFGGMVPFDRTERNEALSALGPDDVEQFPFAEALYHSVPWGFYREQADQYAEKLFEKVFGHERLH